MTIRFLHPTGLARVELLEVLNPRSTGALPEPPSVGATHVALYIEDIHAAYRRLLDADVQIVAAPQSNGRHWAMNVYDPDSCLSMSSRADKLALEAEMPSLGASAASSRSTILVHRERVSGRYSRGRWRTSQLSISIDTTTMTSTRSNPGLDGDVGRAIPLGELIANMAITQRRLHSTTPNMPLRGAGNMLISSSCG
jgi:hypothetical protein